ncbi:MAG: TatD family hydrolase [bacterium]
MFFDTHAHLMMGEFSEDLDQVLLRASEKGITGIINVAYDLNSSRSAAQDFIKYPYIYAACGIHPHDANNISDKDYKVLETLLQMKNVVAVGETGLDYHYMKSDKDAQKKALRSHIELAIKYDKPLIFHVREAEDDAWDVISSYKNITGVFHCFASSADFARKALDRGFYISFTGVITFPKAQDSRDIAKIVPMDKILIETDAPYLAPVPMRGKPRRFPTMLSGQGKCRGKRNEPAYVTYVAEQIANIKGMALDEVAQQTYRNAKALFKIS